MPLLLQFLVLLLFLAMSLQSSGQDVTIASDEACGHRHGLAMTCDLVPISHSRNIEAAFGKANVTSKLIEFENEGYGLAGDDAQQATETMVDWFRSSQRSTPALTQYGLKMKSTD